MMPTTCYVLTDVAREHYWVGDGFVPIADAHDYLGEIPCFLSVRAARMRQRAQRRKGSHLHVARIGPTRIGKFSAGELN